MDRASKLSRSRFLGNVTRKSLLNIPDVCQIVSPLAVDIEIEPSPQRSSLIRTRQPSFLEPRHYTVNASCSVRSTAHLYFLGLATAHNDVSMTEEGAKHIADWMNDGTILGCMYAPDEKCDAPFSYAGQSDIGRENACLRIDGLGYHCHCDDPFSPKCWKSAFSAAESAAAVCKEIRKAKSMCASRP